MRKLDAVLFDLDDTLHDDTLAYQSAAEEVAHEVAAEHGIDALALKDAYIAEAEGFWKRLEPQQMQRRMHNIRMTLWGNALRHVGLDDEDLVVRSADNYHEYRKKYFRPFPGAVDLLRQLKERGYKLGVITNGFSETHREKIALLQLGEYFDAIFIADELGMVKPDPLLFAHACAKLKSAPLHTAMVGDRYDRDIRGALEAGLFTVWVNLRGESRPQGAPPPDAMVSNITDVAAVLERIQSGVSQV